MEATKEARELLALVKLAKIYHVCPAWDGGDLQSLARLREWSDETSEWIASRWPDCDPWAYYNQEGGEVHCHATLAEAREFLAEWCEGGEILEIDTASLWADFDLRIGVEYPHPVVHSMVPAECVRRVS